MLIEAITRSNVADYVSALFEVYIVLIFLYILLNLLFSFGMRLPYSRWSDMLLNFLCDVSDPASRGLRLFADDRDHRPVHRPAAGGQCHPRLSQSARGCPTARRSGRLGLSGWSRSAASPRSWRRC
jgi:hypothetical protein